MFQNRLLLPTKKEVTINAIFFTTGRELGLQRDFNNDPEVLGSPKTRAKINPLVIGDHMPPGAVNKVLN